MLAASGVGMGTDTQAPARPSGIANTSYPEAVVKAAVVAGEVAGVVAAEALCAVGGELAVSGSGREVVQKAVEWTEL